MTDISLFDAIIIWDKILDSKERSQLVTNHWICSCENKNDQTKIDETVAMHAANMNEITLLRLHEAFKLSDRTMFFQRKLEKLDDKIEEKWNGIIEKFKSNKQDTDKLYTQILKYDILPIQVMNAQLSGGYKYDKLSYMIKNMIRESYNPANDKFEPLSICGVYKDDFGVQ